jgi:hypothetical protein
MVYPLFGLALRLIERPPTLAHGLATASAFAGCIFLSKLFSVVLLGPAIAWALWRAALPRLGPARSRGIMLALGTLAAACIGTLAWQHRWSIAQFGFGHAPLLSPLLDGLHDREPFYRVVAVALRDLGMGVLLVAAWRGTAAPVAGLVTLGIAAMWIWPAPMAIALAGSVVVFALDLLQRPARSLVLPACAALLLAIHATILEYSSPRVILAILLAQVVVFAAPLLHRLPAVRFVTAGAGLAVLAALVMLWRFDQAVFAAIGRNWLVTLTPAAHDMWGAVRAQTPADALVFTDQTGPDPGIPGGVNHYPAIAGRQLYVSGWYASPLRSDEAARAERLALNEAVLSGARRPGSLPLSRRYGSYFAVLRADRPPPPGARERYRNAELALYALAEN